MKYLKLFENFHDSENVEWIKERFTSDLQDDRLVMLSFDGHGKKKYLQLVIPVNVRLSAVGEAPMWEPQEPVYYSDGKMADKNKLGKYLPEENRDWGFTFDQVSDFIFSVKSYLESIDKYKGLSILPNEAKQKRMYAHPKDFISIDLDNPEDLAKLESTRIGNLKLFFDDSNEFEEDDDWYDDEDYDDEDYDDEDYDDED